MTLNNEFNYKVHEIKQEIKAKNVRHRGKEAPKHDKINWLENSLAII